MNKENLLYALNKTKVILLPVIISITLLVLSPTMIHRGISIFFLVASVVMFSLSFRSHYLFSRNKVKVALGHGWDIDLVFDGDIPSVTMTNVLLMLKEALTSVQSQLNEYKVSHLTFSLVLSNVVFRIKSRPIEAAGRKGVAAATYHEVKKTYFDVNQISKDVFEYEIMLYIMEEFKPHSTEHDKQAMIAKFKFVPEAFQKEYIDKYIENTDYYNKPF